MVDARRGGHPTPMSDVKSTMKLVEYLDEDNKLSKKGIDKLTKYVDEARGLVEQMKCEEMISFATSAVRDAENGDEVLDHVEKETGIRLRILSGEDEARLTFLAVRRWFGWSAGRIVNLDIGGGSLELTAGSDEDPEVAYSLLLGANRLTHEWFDTDPPDRKKIALLRDYIDAELVEPARHLKSLGEADVAAATSKTFRTLARLTGAAPSSAGPRVKRTLTAAGLRQLIAFISRMTAADRAELEGVSANRSHQIVAGALVAEASMRSLGLEQVQICPWALREGIILRRLDSDLDGKG
nr:Ppx/GppA phosphatase family protein [Corynebacterium sp. TAE3-ERU12]